MPEWTEVDKAGETSDLSRLARQVEATLLENPPGPPQSSQFLPVFTSGRCSFAESLMVVTTCCTTISISSNKNKCSTGNFRIIIFNYRNAIAFAVLWLSDAIASDNRYLYIVMQQNQGQYLTVYQTFLKLIICYF